MRNACDQYEMKLQQLGLLPNKSITAARKALFVAMAAVLVLASGIKIVVALSRGRTNIEFLIILTVVAILILRKVAFPRQTARGESDDRRTCSGSSRD